MKLSKNLIKIFNQAKVPGILYNHNTDCALLKTNTSHLLVRLIKSSFCTVSQITLDKHIEILQVCLNRLDIVSSQLAWF